MPFELLEQAARIAAGMVQGAGEPVFARRSHIALHAEALHFEPHPWMQGARLERGFANFMLSGAFFEEALERAGDLRSIEINPRWDEATLFCPAVYAALRLSGGDCGALTDEQQDAVVAALALPLEKNLAVRLDSAAVQARVAFGQDAQQVSNLLYEIWKRKG